MRIEKCWFCSSNIYQGHGTIYVRNDAKVFRFCRPKCRKLFARRVNPRKVKWTKISRKMANKELCNDAILTFEHRLNEPRMYDRAEAERTLSSIPRILEIRKRREDFFIKDRILTGQEMNKESDLKYIERHANLLEEEVAGEKQVAKAKKREAQTN
ncbi:60S RIBOSOMAL PROTEIN L24 [Encephalitozoon cuniculi GB-M1]|uniref:Probable ribosome biogenesis protein RLP24 n=2 Tax=Encephalitozoon cuniculi TaxID=6035 RepID=RLP24_ENCCU|nr:ribosome biogenesis protein RLP24 [Encephalitozoon cuniculi GB-M1]Q8SSF6.1 RecName: Full=Probable ribosome biogenesis protein RLP24 [Encephalitozoon cuniculi GB-M1]AGE95619.1 60S ribosomal protein l24 [Encephalitozoon cuniculi]KMV66599.1 ribosomal protein L24 [Encephalitozoon cuniculi EcunIII-L]UYI28272.1 ribosomal protein L24 [Encephalitozoon cuniculi]CAD25110.1 60S RIBOSOMAL PROTEIN L24 [Encephalitozoon cuniculi GB-M1]